MTERPVFAPPADGVRDVFRRARARRRRRALATTTGVAVAGTIAGVLAFAPDVGAGADRLSVVPASPDRTQSPAPHETPRAPRVTPSSLPGGQRPTAAGSAPAAGGPGPARVQPADSPSPYAPPRRHSAAAPISRSTVGMNAGCDAATAAAGDGWCLLYTGPHSARRKHVVALSVQLCRHNVYGDGTVHFSDTRQIDFELLDRSGATVWQAGQGVGNRAVASTQVVRAGTCLRWSADWDTIAPSGFYAPPGDYSVSVGLDTSDASTTTGGDVLTLTD